MKLISIKNLHSYRTTCSATHLGGHAQLGAVLAWEGVGGQKLPFPKEPHPLLCRVAQQVSTAHNLCTKVGGRTVLRGNNC